MAQSYLRSAIRDARITPDERGLMPLDEARALVAATRVFEQGQSREVDGTFVEDADRVWAALLSLDDGDEFVRHGKRMGWAYMVRGHHNTALVERYGAAVLPWIAYAVNPNGALTNVPWCRVACLLQLGGAEAYNLAARIREVRGSKKNRFTQTVIAPDGPLLDAWIQRHPDEGLPLLAADALAGAPWALESLERVAKVDPIGARASIAAAHGDEAADALFKQLRLKAKVRSKKVRDLLAAAEEIAAPAGPSVSLLNMDGHFLAFRAPYWMDESVLVAGMRVTGFAHAAGDAIVFQSLATGGHDDTIRLDIHAFGPGFCDEFAGLAEFTVDLVDGDRLPERLADYPTDDDGQRVCCFSLHGTATVVPLPTDRKLRRDLDPAAAVLVALSQKPLRATAFLDEAALAKVVGLPSDAVAVFSLDAWQHPDDKPASAVVDMVALVEALRARRRITSVPKGTTDEAHLKKRLRDVGWRDDDDVWRI